MSKFILGAVSITENKEGINLIQDCTGHKEELHFTVMKITLLHHEYAEKRNADTYAG
jgi:hypothetical protein